jgi:hypothetical protein
MHVSGRPPRATPNRQTNQQANRAGRGAEIEFHCSIRVEIASGCEQDQGVGHSCLSARGTRGPDHVLIPAVGHNVMSGLDTAVLAVSRTCCFRASPYRRMDGPPSGSLPIGKGALGWRWHGGRIASGCQPVSHGSSRIRRTDPCRFCRPEVTCYAVAVCQEHGHTIGRSAAYHDGHGI